ncbi:hypothetical protein GQ457_06G019140 [Hibiscus cannabinus]
MCNLQVIKNGGKLKAVNSAALAVVGSAKKVPTKVGPWEENFHYNVAPMDEFDVVLGQDILTLAQAIHVPTATTILKRKTKKTLVAIQAYQGVSDCAVNEDVDKRKYPQFEHFNVYCGHFYNVYLAYMYGVDNRQVFGLIQRVMADFIGKEHSQVPHGFVTE